MKIVIDMSEEKYEWIKKNNPNADPNSIVGAVANGTPLPKGHGRLKDADALKMRLTRPIFGDYEQKVIWKAIEDELTIIEADKGEEE